MTKSILFLAPEFPPYGATGSIRPAKFAKYLARSGWNVVVLTFDHAEKLYADMLHDLPDVQIQRCGVPKKIMVNDQGVAFLFQGFRRAMTLARDTRPDFIFVSMPTFLNSILALVMKKRFDIHYVLDYRDLWVGDPYPRRTFKGRVFRLLSKIIEPIILKNAHFSCYVSDSMLRDQTELYPWLARKRTKVISTGFDHEDIRRVKLGNKKNGFIGHIGNADPDMNIADFVRVAQDLGVQKLMAGKGFKFLFVGRKNRYLKELLDAATTNFFVFLEQVDHNEALQLMADCDGLVILGSNSAQRLNRKVFEYSALNRNIYYLGNKKSPTAAVVNEFGGIVCDSSDMISKVKVFLNSLSYDPMNVTERYSEEALVKSLINELNR